MYREIAGTDERVRAIPGVRDRRVRATKVRLYRGVHLRGFGDYENYLSDGSNGDHIEGIEFII